MRNIVFFTLFGVDYYFWCSSQNYRQSTGRHKQNQVIPKNTTIMKAQMAKEAVDSYLDILKK